MIESEAVMFGRGDHAARLFGSVTDGIIKRTFDQSGGIVFPTSPILVSTPLSFSG